MKKKKAVSPFIRFLLVAYGAAMLWLLFGRSGGWDAGISYREMLRRNTNLAPLFTIRNYWHVVLYSTDKALFLHCLINLAGNVLLFIPAGWLLPANFKAQKRLLPFLLTCIGSIVLIESLQLLTLLGSFDVDDILLNLTGLLLGYIFYRVSHK